MVSSNTAELVAAVKRFNDADRNRHDFRIEVANALVKASKSQSITSLSLITGINRTTIYWLIETWSDDATNNGNRSNRASQS